MLKFIARLLSKIFGFLGGNKMPRNTQTLSNVDTAWLNLDEPTNMMMITGVMTFRKPINLDHLQAVIEHRWLKFDRFSQRLVRPNGAAAKPYWETDPYFDIRSHFHRIALPAPGDQEALQQMVSDLMSTPLDFSKPLWQFHLVENYGDGCAIVARIHHSIADGLALIYVLLSLSDMTPDAPWPEADLDLEEDDDGGIFSGALGALFRHSRSLLRTAGTISGKVVRGSWSTIRDPNKAMRLAHSGADAGYATSRLLLRPDDPQTTFRGALGAVKKGAWSRPVPLKDVKRIKNATRTTVNDVLVSAMAGALRRYMLDKGDEPLDFRTTIPVNMRTPQEMGQLGNKFGLVFLNLPISIADPLDRLAEVHVRMEELKRSAEAGVILATLNVVGMSPSQVQDVIVSILARKASGVLTNVPGPPIPLFLAGREIEDIMFWAPQAGRLGLGISILSYAGKVYLGVATDVNIIPDPETVIKGFYEELDLLLTTIPPDQKRKAPAVQKQSPKQSDDLTQIHGLTSAVAELLQREGILNYEQLAACNGQSLRRILDDAGPPSSNLDPANWPAQARYLSQIRHDSETAGA